MELSRLSHSCLVVDQPPGLVNTQTSTRQTFLHHSCAQRVGKKECNLITIQHCPPRTLSDCLTCLYLVSVKSFVTLFPTLTTSLIVDFLMAQAPCPLESSLQFVTSPPPPQRHPKPLHLLPLNSELLRETLELSWSTNTPQPRGLSLCLTCSAWM